MPPAKSFYDDDGAEDGNDDDGNGWIMYWLRRLFDLEPMSTGH